MKKAFFFNIALLCTVLTFAQTVPAGENISLDQQLSQVNQSTIISGIIYERVLQIANLYNFNKSNTFNMATKFYIHAS